MSSAQRNPVQQIAARLLPWRQEQPSIVQYVEAAKYVGGGTIERKWPVSHVYDKILFFSGIANFGLKATLVWAASSIIFGGINCTVKTNICDNIDATKNTAAVIAASTATATALFTPLDRGLSLGTFLTLAQRKKRGKDAAERLFDGVVTDDGLINGTKLLTAMQNFYVTKKAIQEFYPEFETTSPEYQRKDPAVISYVENGNAAIESILSLFEPEKNILTEAEAKLRYYNNLEDDQYKEKYFLDFTEQFADPQFVDALALGIFNGDDHQELVDALAQYGDKDKLYEALFDLCTNATIAVDVIHKLQERIPDALPKNIKEYRERLEIRRNNLIKNHPDIAKGYQLEISVDDIVYQIETDGSGILEEAKNDLCGYKDNRYSNQYRKKYFDDLTAKFADPKFIRALAKGILSGDDHQDLVDALKQYGDGNKLDEDLCNLRTNAPKIYAVNAAFAALDISGVVHLPSQANDGNREAQWDARLAALETGIEVARAALNPQQQATMARLEREVREGRGGGR
jgi:hypothetical protein